MGKYDSHFDDQITGNTTQWVKGEDLSMQNVVTLKLYTDFDDLQWAMKQCFRLETMADTKQEHHERELKLHRHDQRLREQLETRIEVFFHWRGALMIVLNKFGTRWRDIENTEA